MKLTVNQMLVLHEWNEKRKGKAMMEDIIKLIIHEAQGKEGRQMHHKLKEVVTEISLIIYAISKDLIAIDSLEIHEIRKAEMRALVLTSHKT